MQKTVGHFGVSVLCFALAAALAAAAAAVVVVVFVFVAVFVVVVVVLFLESRVDSCVFVREGTMTKSMRQLDEHPRSAQRGKARREEHAHAHAHSLSHSDHACYAPSLYESPYWHFDCCRGGGSCARSRGHRLHGLQRHLRHYKEHEKDGMCVWCLWRVGILYMLHMRCAVYEWVM